MARINLVTDENAQGKAKELLDGAKAQMGMVPNIFRGLANSPAVLESYMTQGKILAQGTLSPQLREQIALTVAGTNSCNYCASAHTALGKGAGLSEDETRRNLFGKSEDQTAQAVLNFAARVVETKGNVSDSDLKEVRDAGFSDGAITEIVSHVAANIFTNYFNHVAQTEIDFPIVDTQVTARAA